MFANAAKNLIARRCFSHDAGRVLVNAPFATKPLTKPSPSVGMQDQATKLWSMNPGLVVTLSAFGAMVAGCVVHEATRFTSVNTSVEVAMEDEKAVREPSKFLRHNTMNPKRNA
mmetsp:Transcript_6357/g.15834  ORF Transcript_6357/g.15834 Transcript_6357/m.15834 type:complete len:114 (-) Transcript_6357:195-536(-)|eukprot:CAMPEP_0181108294 /NCGR_PEP_ID=MMETSP1071-20121207/17552_1 /TAXON_ID=35127 /ORGANISM="Thalassiosira sp., Strain NH16" /LENGTH=113 /DNA_ID=CAMNT_0023191885 /DNA_START=62 /DNA_END=403 /DNA_ORIENTATION=+